MNGFRRYGSWRPKPGSTPTPCAQRTNGRFVTGDTTAIGSVRDRVARLRVSSFAADMGRLGYHKEQVLQLLREEEVF